MAFEEITPDMFDSEVESVKEEEIAELPDETTDEGVKEQEVTEPVSESSQDDKTNSAFAEMRRAREEAERKAEELEKRIAELEKPDEEEEVDYSESALEELLSERTIEEKISFIAESEGISNEEAMARITYEAEKREYEDTISQQQEEIEALKKQNEEWKLESATHEAEKEMAEDLATIRKFDPTIKSLEDLPPSYVKFRNTKLFDGTYMSPEESYFAAKQMEERTKVKPAQDIGKVNRSEAESEYYTSWDEINAMTSEEKTRNADKIMRSLSRLK